MIRILGLDVGTARIGVALSDPLGMTAQPLEVIVRKKTDPATRIRELIEEYEIQRIVVGQPYTLSGDEGLATAAVGSFVADLKKHVSVPIELWDERMSTAQAERMMISGGARREKRKQSVDKVAASLILQSYLDAHAASL